MLNFEARLLAVFAGSSTSLGFATTEAMRLDTASSAPSTIVDDAPPSGQRRLTEVLLVRRGSQFRRLHDL